MNQTRQTLQQRIDYTHRFNIKTGRHGWLRLTPAYSVKVVEEIIENSEPHLSILDPFCGTGTTALSAAGRGHNATTLDVNPFLIWLAGTKTASYSASVLEGVEAAGGVAVDLARRQAVDPTPEPPINRIERWWAESTRQFFCYLKSSIAQVTHDDRMMSDLLHVAFCRTLIRLSNATFNHQSMSFRDKPQSGFDWSLDVGSFFLADLRFVIRGATENPPGNTSVIQGDARDLPSVLHARFDSVVTSPPYANRMSYIRELRPYMYWLGYLTTGRDAGEMDWLAIGGTWGIATSRLADWSAKGNCWLPDTITMMLTEIAHNHNANGVLLANYVMKYFEDMSQHFSGLRGVLNPGARVHYIVGNSTFYGVLVPTEKIYGAMLQQYGFEDVDVRPIRKRNSKKELIEFDVSATWPG